VLDTHAGIGAYDLAGEEATRTGEWRAGIARVAEAPDPALADYLRLMREAGWPRAYPGSPLIARAMLRPGDSLVLCELHPEDHVALRRQLGRDGQVAIHRRDAWEAIRALTPFPERRGLVLIDPPFEQEGEFDRMAASIAEIRHRFRAGTVAAWYPIKHRAPVRAFHAALRDAGVPDCLACELTLREPTDPTRLNGCGVLVANPPFRFEAEAETILRVLLPRLAGGEDGAAAGVARITPE
jgi:23S rRNA (adenine2030-N6)-methyltransferase